MSQSGVTRKRVAIFSIIAGATLVLSLFTPRFLVTLPVMVTVGLAIVGAVRKESPRPLPYIIGSAAVLLVLLSSGGFSGGLAPRPVAASDLYKSATWDYGSAKDSMRGTTSKWATLYSPTDLNFSAPYEGQNAAHIQVDDTDSFIFQVDKGQLICEDPKHVSIKFDNGPVWTYPCEPGANGDSTVIYVQSTDDPSPGQPKSPIDGILHSKTMMIEFQAYDNGYPQVTFNVAGLDKSKL